MKCHQCHFEDTKVIESRDSSDGYSTRRRRECIKCNLRFTTYERLERPQLVVIKRDGSRQLFDRGKLIAGLNRACEKTPVSGMQIDNLVNNVEKEIYARGDAEVESNDIGDMVIGSLSELSEVAYIRFASVYRRFSDITGFEAELAQIRAKHTKHKVSTKS